MAVAYRLDPAVRPSWYDLELWCDVDVPAFKGVVTIKVHAAQDRPFLELHAGKTLAVTSAALDGQDVPTTTDTGHPPEEEVLRIAAPCAAGNHALRLEFTGEYNAAAHGIYVSLWRGVRTLVTQFEATSARLAFPCFDEPAFKAQFALVMHSKLPPPVDGVVPWQVLSNMPLDDSSSTATTFRFLPTPVMSTYILAFVIAPLVKCPEARASPSPDGGPVVTVWAHPGDEPLTTLAQDFAERALRTLQALFQYPYDLPKLDLVPVFDFDAGAMENWGLVTFRASHLLVDEAKAAADTKAAMMDIVAHELAHQWFGNLVTMAWWDDIWLNESFATFAAAWVTSRVVRDAPAAGGRYGFLTEENVWLAFVEREMTTALESDALAASRPIYVDPSFMAKTADIEQLFDDKAYAKGGVVLRMLFLYIGEPAMTKGLHTYLKTYAYGNATSQQLWEALGEDVAGWVKPWITQPGFPVVTVTASGGFSQTRFTALGATASPLPPSNWLMPLSDGDAGRTLTEHATAGPFATTTYLNAGFVVPAIVVGEVNDDGVELALFDVPPDGDDATTMSKLVSLRLAVESGLRPVTPRALDFLLHCLGDDGCEFSNKLAYDMYRRWAALCSAPDRLVHSACSALIAARMDSLARFVRRSVGRVRKPRDGGSRSEPCRSAKHWRDAAALAVLVDSPDQQVCKLISRLVKAFVDNPRVMDVGAVAVVLKEMARHIHRYPTYLAHVQDMYLANQNPQLNPMLVNMMGSVDDADASRAALDWALTNVRASDVVYLFFRDYSHRQTVRNQWLQANWAGLQAGQGRHGMAYIVKHALIHVRSDEELAQWDAFFAANKETVSAYHLAVQEGLEKARVNIQAAAVLASQLCACLQ